MSILLLFCRKLLDNQVALTDDERQKLRQEYKQKSSEVDVDSASSLSACTEFSSGRTLADKLARKRSLHLEAIDKKQDEEIEVLTQHQLLQFSIVVRQSCRERAYRNRLPSE